MVRSVGRGLDPSAGVGGSGSLRGWLPGEGRRRKPPRGSGDAAPYGLPGNGRQREAAPHPALRGHLPPGGKARAVVEGFIPPGVLAAAGGRGGVGAPRPTDGDMETLWGLRGHPFPGRRAVGGGHARPRGWREHPSMVWSVGRGLDPSAGDCPGDGCWRKPPRGVGDAAPYGLPGNGRRREPAPHPALRGHLPPKGKARAVVEGFIPPGVLAAAGGRGGVGAPRPTDGDMETPAGFTRTPVPGPPHGRGRACPARGVTQTPVNGSVRREGS